MRQTDVIDWVAGQVETVLNTVSYCTVSTPSQHVGLAKDRDEQRYPFIGIQRIATASESAGIGNDTLKVTDIQYTNDVADAIVYARDSRLRLNVIPVTDGDYAVRDKLSGDIQDQLLRTAQRVKTDPTFTLPDTMEKPEVGEATPQGRPDEFVYADGVPVEIPFTRLITDDSIAGVKRVDLDLTVGDTLDQPVEDGGAAVAFEESF